MTVENESHLITTKRKLVASNKVLNVFMDEISSDDKLIMDDYIVVAPKRSVADGVTGVAVLPVYHGKLGLLRIFRYAAKFDSWEVPRGFAEAEESPVDTAARELLEETGLNCNKTSMRSLGFITPDAGILDARIHLFLAMDCVIKQPFVSNEMGHLEFRFFTSEEMDEMIANSEIQDPSTIIAFYKFTRLKI